MVARRLQNVGFIGWVPSGGPTWAAGAPATGRSLLPIKLGLLGSGASQTLRAPSPRLGYLAGDARNPNTRAKVSISR